MNTCYQGMRFLLTPLIICIHTGRTGVFCVTQHQETNEKKLPQRTIICQTLRKHILLNFWKFDSKYFPGVWCLITLWQSNKVRVAEDKTIKKMTWTGKKSLQVNVRSSYWGFELLGVKCKPLYLIIIKSQFLSFRSEVWMEHTWLMLYSKIDLVKKSDLWSLITREENGTFWRHQKLIIMVSLQTAVL